MNEKNQEREVVFNLEKIYLKDVSYEAPYVPAIFTEKDAPEVGIQLGIEHSKLDQEFFEVILSVTVTAKLRDKVVFLTEAKQAGLFRVNGVADTELNKVLEIACPNILLPFIREAINDLTQKGGFPQLLINPVNFEALYQQKQAAGTKTQAGH
jgi:preprotein translocase subunit SecB